MPPINKGQTALVDRHLARDLDRVEERAFLAQLEREWNLREAFTLRYEELVNQRGLFAFAHRNPEVAHCFSVETLERFLRGQLDGLDRQTVESHLSCPLCGLEVRFLRKQLQESNGTMSRDYARPQGVRGSKPYAAAAGRTRGAWGLDRRDVIAAAVCAASALSLFWLIPSQESEQPGAPTYREATGFVIESALPDAITVARDAFVLSWSVNFEAQEYEITVSTDDFNVLVSAKSLKTPEFHVPADRLADVPSGTTLFWNVTAKHHDGRSTRSETFKTVVR